MIVSSRKLTLPQVKKTRIAVPGTLTTRLPHPQALCPRTSKTAVVPFDKIIPAVASGEFDMAYLHHPRRPTHLRQRRPN